MDRLGRARIHGHEPQETHRLGEGIQRAQPGGPQLGGLHFPETRRGAVEPGLQLGSKFLFVHSVIPFALRTFAKAWVAREQCVFTLPSEHPITLAVSLTSSSSQ